MYNQTAQGAIPTIAGVLGGVGKALTFNPLIISAEHLIEVSVYAGASAFVGYLVKFFLDQVTKRAGGKEESK